VPARLDPVTADDQGIGIAVESQRRDGHSARRGKSDDPKPVFGPSKVLKPRSGIEERHFFSAVGIDRGNPIALRAIAQRQLSQRLDSSDAPP